MVHQRDDPGTFSILCVDGEISAVSLRLRHSAAERHCPHESLPTAARTTGRSTGSPKIQRFGDDRCRVHRLAFATFSAGLVNQDLTTVGMAIAGSSLLTMAHALDRSTSV